MARTGSEVVSNTALGATLRYQAKGSEDFFKARLTEKHKDRIIIIPLAGPHFEKRGESAIKISKEEWDDRIKGMQGRQPGTSPKKSDDEEEEASPKPAPKNSAKPAAKDTKQSDTKKNENKDDSPVQYDLDSAKKELTDKIEELDTLIYTFEDALEAMENIKASMTAIHSFLDNLKMTDEDEDEEGSSPEPETKPRTRRSRRTHDQDEA